MHGFVEAPITFAPTFKFQDEGDTVFTETGKPVASAETGKATESKRTSGSIPDGNDTYPYTKYSKKRIPSWCDRVLCRSLGDDGNGAVRWVAYKSCPAVASSDHTPVYAVCEVDVYGRSQPEKLPVTPNKKEEGLPIETETEVLPSQTENNAPGEGDGELTTRDQTIPIGTAIGASSVSPKTPPRKLFLKFSVASFRVTLEAFTDPADTKPDCDAHDAHDAPTYDVPGTPMYRAGSVSKKESMMEKLMASTHVSSGDSVAGRETVTPRNTTKSFVAKPSGTKPSSAEASASALPAMDRLNKGAVAVARRDLLLLLGGAAAEHVLDRAAPLRLDRAAAALVLALGLPGRRELRGGRHLGEVLAQPGRLGLGAHRVAAAVVDALLGRRLQHRDHLLELGDHLGGKDLRPY